jgi:DNA-binding LytR/AlgR family response regulator
VLRSGGRTFHARAGDFLSAKAAGNYVEARFAGAPGAPQGFLARTTLTALETQLREAGVDARRVHRSWLINGDAIAATAPTGDGDLKIRLRDGSEVPGSRRYRSAIVPV